MSTWREVIFDAVGADERWLVVNGVSLLIDLLGFESQLLILERLKLESYY